MTQLEPNLEPRLIERKLPDFDSLSTEDLAKLAEAARAEEESLERIYSALSVATVRDKLGLAALAILNVSECPIYIEESPVDVDGRGEKAELLSKISDSSLVGLAIAILEGLQSSGEDDAIVPPDCEFDE